MSDYGPYDAYMSAANKTKCTSLVMLIVAAHNNVEDSDEYPGAAFAGAAQFKAITAHLKSCSDCKKHPLLNT
jgi:hypothetical protein